jgi:dihydroorotate dehydrogenase (fumarate)/dihydropyrimidine dehydrogenase (NAD+) subunit PreA
MANLKTEFCGLEFKNPIVVASAETGNSLDNIKKCIDYGAGELLSRQWATSRECKPLLITPICNIK